MDILKYYDIKTSGKKAVVIGRSNIVGKPMAILLMQRGIDATVTVCNTKTPDLKEYTRDADIIVVMDKDYNMASDKIHLKVITHEKIVYEDYIDELSNGHTNGVPVWLLTTIYYLVKFVAPITIIAVMLGNFIL